ncbi:MAG TPA: hypothetical protein VG056_08255 [Pirellulales bacterium]|jgi:hypothetical protein|nr:hypothetical protein [Pirellulales bacterium]
MQRAAIIAVLALAGLAVWSFECAGGNNERNESLEQIAENAVSDDANVSEPAIRKLRMQGPAGLQALLAAHDEMIRKRTAMQGLVIVSSAAKHEPDPDEHAWQRLRAALDQVSGQRDCHASRLFWYTDFDEAKAAAKREGKPILSLRLLGKLTDEYSCANSRFFRTTLYANAEISKALGDRFILHWKSVRPVPKVTIDFGDGRKLERTLTGNSIHYVLDSDGRIVDAFPGLYGPKAFLRELERAEQAAKQAMSMSPGKRECFLAEYHRDRASAIEMVWQQDLKTLGITVASVETPNAATANTTISPEYAPIVAQPNPALVSGPSTPPPSAMTAGKAAIGKGFVEMPIIKSAALSSDAALTQATTGDVWNRIAQLHFGDSQLDAASVALIRSQHPAAAKAARLAISKMAVEDPLVRMVRSFQGSIGIDTVRNEYLFHRQIHQWLAATATPEIDAFNDRVYAELFLTPRSDPWLGLMPADTYTALENNGVQQVSIDKR